MKIREHYCYEFGINSKFIIIFGKIINDIVNVHNVYFTGHDKEFEAIEFLKFSNLNLINFYEEIKK